MKSIGRCVALIAALILVAMAHSCAGTAERKAASEADGMVLRDEGFNALNSGNLEMAHFKLTKAVRMIPDDPEARFGLGTVYLLRNDYELAVEELEKAIKLDKTHADAYNNLGLTYMNLGRWNQAISTSQKALDQVIYDTPERAMTIMGWSYYKKGETVRGLELLQRALRLKGNLPDTENKIATIYLEEGRLDKAKAYLVDLVRRVPEFTGARLNMGIVFYKERDYVAARREFRKVLEMADARSEEGKLARGYLDLIE